jgi:hypothetical protein
MNMVTLHVVNVMMDYKEMCEYQLKWISSVFNPSSLTQD